MMFKKIGDDNRILGSNFPKFVPPLFSIVVFQKALHILSDKATEEVFFKIGKSLGKVIATKINDNYKVNQIDLVKLALMEIASMGMGDSKIIILNPYKSQSIIRNMNNPWAKQFKKTFEGQSDGIDFFLSGVYSGIFSIALKRDCFFNEIMCISKGDSFCAFELLDSQTISENFSQQEIDMAISEKNLMVKKQFFEPNDLIQRMFGMNHITLSQGQLKLWTIYCIMLPFELYQIVFQIMDKKIKMEDVLFYLSMVQAKIAVLFQVNKFGIEKGNATFNSLLQQLEFFGSGKGNLIGQDNNSTEVEFKNYIPLIQHRQMFPKEEFHPYFAAGILIGTIKFSYDLNIESYNVLIDDRVKIKIKFVKQEHCFFERIKNQIKNKEIKIIIEEKMKHQYYLN